MAKRSFDIVASFLGLILISPLLLIITILIIIQMRRPVIFCQARVGRYGKPFVMYKFRTMIVNDAKNTTSVAGDSRITSLGAILRRYKLDELPELWNILKGDMSFVGPRPDVPEYAERLKGEDRLILSLRPGITGPATIKYAREEELLATVSDPQRYTDEIIWPDKVKINLSYYYNRNFLLDIRIIFKTIFN